MPTPATPRIALPSTRSLGVLLVACAAVLVLLHLGVLIARHVFDHPYLFGLAHRFDMDQEGNVPTLFTVLVLMSAGVLAGLHAAIERARGGPHVTAWILLAAALGWFGFDDGAEIHELVSRYLRPIVSEAELLGVAIVLVGGAAFLAIAWRSRPFLQSLPAHVRHRLAAAVLLYFAGTIGFEIVGWEIWRFYGLESLAFEVVATVEEILEMSAAILFLVTLRAHLGAREPELLLDL